MGRRSIRAFCPRCRHQQPFVRARFDWRLHGLMTVFTFGIWLVAALSSAVKRILWPWTCEHCGWHEPDFRSPKERLAGSTMSFARAGDPVFRLPGENGSYCLGSRQTLLRTTRPPRFDLPRRLNRISSDQSVAKWRECSTELWERIRSIPHILELSFHPRFARHSAHDRPKGRVHRA